MSDITKCVTSNCIMKENCYRYTAMPHQYNQYYQNFIPNDATEEEDFYCDFFLPIKNDELKN